ncbi:hypothetical protein KK083_13480 [Fulvivirgaceae bacterium PWU4]|uniref:Uncharacterized protein n=1 Tax=Chryseosolibacter histidini TaxID=2782349 RepID=A0AAP2GND2_9BACT|nr:hypothetical protein [Chryseosolibacter histidini]MBT1697898.1 hypothetical protein [Chryseosolibacter histidini]
MIEHDKNNRPRKIIIPVSTQDDILRYQLGILGILSKIEVGKCTPSLREDVKATYDLLKHMQAEDNIEQLVAVGKLRQSAM